MKTFRLKYRPFPNVFIDEMDIEAETLILAHVELKKVFPNGVILVSGEVGVPVDEELDNVIYVDFKARKRIAA